MIDVRKDTVVGLFAVVLGALYGVLTWQLPRATIGSPVAPLIFPAMLAGMTLVLGIGVLAWDRKKAASGAENKRGHNDPGYWKLIVGTLVLCLIYGAVFEHLGYMVSTLAFLFALLMLVNEAKRWKSNVVIAVTFTVALWAAFVWGFQINLPTLTQGGMF